MSELIFHRLAVDSARLRGFTDFRGRVAAIWQRLTGCAQLLPLVPDTDFYLDCPTTTLKKKKKKKGLFFLQPFVSSSEFHFTAFFKTRVDACSGKRRHRPPAAYFRSAAMFLSEAAKGRKSQRRTLTNVSAWMRRVKRFPSAELAPSAVNKSSRPPLEP